MMIKTSYKVTSYNSMSTAAKFIKYGQAVLLKELSDLSLT